MGTISNDQHGIPNKKLYDAIARAMKVKKGLFAPRRIDEDLACACTELYGLTVDELTDLDFLSFFPGLEDLEVKRANLSDIEGLRYVPNLDYLALYGHNLTDLSPLEHCRKLKYLQLEPRHSEQTATQSRIGDFGVLGRLSGLSLLSLPHHAISDIAWITGLQKLTDVTLAHNPITDFSPLLQLPDLGEVYLDPTQRAYIDERYGHLQIEFED